VSVLSMLGAYPAEEAPTNVEERLLELERRMGVNLPEDLASIIKEYNGAPIAFDKDIRFVPHEPPPWAREDGSLSLYSILGLSGEHNNSLAHFSNYLGRLPCGILPIADPGGGNLIVMSLFGQQRGKVFFWDHESEQPGTIVDDSDFRSLYKIADSFDEFLKQLAVGQDETHVDTSKVKLWLSDDLFE
jgi:hypothetical protein